MPLHLKAKHQQIVTKQGEVLPCNQQPLNINGNPHSMQYKTRDMYGHN
jgi:hypothetical protein